MQTRIIKKWRDFNSLEDEWNGMLRSSQADSVFLTWEWLTAWIASAGKECEPFIVTVRDQVGRLVGAAPLYCSSSILGGCIHYRTLLPMADYATGFEYPDWIVTGADQAGVSQAIATALNQARADWDLLWMARLAGWSGALKRITSACESAGLLWRSREREFSLIDLPASMEAFERSLSSNRRQQLRRKRRRLQREKAVVTTRCQSHDELPEYLEALFALHHLRWAPLGDPGCFIRKPAEAAFYSQFLPMALDAGWLAMYALRHQGEIRAVQVGYNYGGVFHQMQEGFDPQFYPGIGNVLRAEVIQACIDEGISAYDFLGGHTEHKRRWNAHLRIGFDLLIGNANLKSRLLQTNQIWPTGRFLRLAGRDRRPGER
ncbi:GNAT family N-acetyltransferase [endosymbiont of Ridgeia piscesae]|jgi:CelD/BcsL family acetyltransferase involved in cellulose biosynthesis|uniref:Acetyltransferase involved in cellulose biosynthesis, CelD/BcsL family n=2 Tax=endosymbiont of Ridgeia piscesae TaxID=54398 RepID=A0A0T5ZAZ8_9GAMM|nr:GNAT family N-acetyltransferase [endosymbiont of Ridgeia piscesae]KRT55792.1 Acetyltransferase involved in cellulose biosynthesis, CelD/BcsL family [endosymbiont of Ridgeia piscesae]KRT60010.1 Acetyltransferase involved in cellulose biosynthesis, CelD/BcsL family [endosymbiont of Ridgeia piscesae]